MILGAVRNILLSSTDVTDLIGTRLIPGNLPEGAILPAADMRIVTTDVEHYLGGSLAFYSSTVTIDCYSTDDPAEADRVAMAMMAPGLLVGFKGDQDGIHLRGVEIRQGLSQSTEGVSPGSDLIRFVSSCTFTVHWGAEC